MNHTENPIAVQSKEWIMESLIELMNDKTFQEITISELARCADLGRKTFYRNFSSKEDVLNAYLNKLIRQFVNHLSLMNTLTPRDAILELFTLCQNNKLFLIGLQKSKMLGYLLDEWNVVLPIIHEMMNKKIPNFPNSHSKKGVEYTLAFNAGGVWNVLVKWINTGMSESPEELTGIIVNLIEFDSKPN